MADPLPYASAARPLPAVARRRRRTVALAVGLPLAVVACFAYFVLGVGRRSRAVEGAGSAQVIARGDEAWLFLDVDRNVWDPSIFAGPPSGRVVQQVLVVFDERG